jgi:hypothetical protein
MLKVKVNYPTIDIKATEKAIHEEMTSFVIDTLGVWVNQSTGPVPVWSGAARASFLKLADQAKTTIIISPVVASRIPLGIETSEGTVIATPGREYGWLWSSDLAHIGIVDDRVDFTNAGLRAIDGLKPELPELQIKGKS